MGLRGEAAIVGYVELPPERMTASPAPFVIEQWAELGAAALADAGLPFEVVDGIVASHLAESEIFVPPPSPNTSEWGRGSPNTWTWVAPAPRPWCGEPPPPSNSASATPSCARCPPGTSPRCRRRNPDRSATPCISGRRATNTALPRPNSRSPTEISARTDRMARLPNATRRSTATTSGRWPRSSSTSAPTPTTPRARSGRTSH